MSKFTTAGLGCHGNEICEIWLTTG